MHAKTNGNNACKVYLVYLNDQVKEGRADTIHFQMTVYAGHCGFYLSLALSAWQHFVHRPPFPSPTLALPSLTYIMRPIVAPPNSPASVALPFLTSENEVALPLMLISTHHV